MIVVTVFPFDFDPDGIPFGSQSKGKLSPRSYPIQHERKWKHGFLSARVKEQSQEAGVKSDDLILWKIGTGTLESETAGSRILFRRIFNCKISYFILSYF